MAHQTLTVALLFIATYVQAEVRFIEGEQTIQSIAQSPHVTITGNISSDDANRLPSLLVTATASSKWRVAGDLAPLIALNSLGGDVKAAIRIGRMLRSLNAWVVVGQNANCSSACILILAAGAKRSVFAGGNVGLHRPFFDESYFAGLSATKAREKYRELERTVKDYLQEMGMPEALFEKMLSIPSRRVEYLAEDEIKAMGLDGVDAAIEELERAQEKAHFSSDPAMYKYLQDLRNCIDLKRRLEVCEEMAGEVYRRSKETK